MSFKQLKGINFGGWLSQSDYSVAHFNSFITENDVKRAAELGMNVIRLPFDHNIFYQDFNPEKPFQPEIGLSYLEAFVGWCEQHKITVLLDLHKVKGHSFTSKKNALWTDEQLQEKVQELWLTIAGSFKNRDNIIFEILNEPIVPETRTWLDFCERIIQALRKAGVKNYLLIESNYCADSREYKTMKPFTDDNIIYSFHFYHPIFFTHQRAYWIEFYDKLKGSVAYPGVVPVPDKKIINSLGVPFTQDFIEQKGQQWDYYKLAEYLRPVVDFKKKYKKHVLCGEFGVILTAPRDSQLNWVRDVIDLFNEHSISWCYWNYKNMDYGLVYDQGVYAHYNRYQNRDKLDQELAVLLQQACS